MVKPYGLWPADTHPEAQLAEAAEANIAARCGSPDRVVPAENTTVVQSGIGRAASIPSRQQTIVFIGVDLQEVLFCAQPPHRPRADVLVRLLA